MNWSSRILRCVLSSCRSKIYVPEDSLFMCSISEKISLFFNSCIVLHNPDNKIILVFIFCLIKIIILVFQYNFRFTQYTSISIYLFLVSYISYIFQFFLIHIFRSKTIFYRMEGVLSCVLGWS